MKHSAKFAWLAAGVILGALFVWLQSKPVQAYNDRFNDFIMCTGPVSVTPQAQTDGVWLLDYRTGKLLGTRDRPQYR
ncbi:MAG: hypothetical protein KatS3mg105_4374 [Gemmatales bacterium]|nr:MAG: hypothetical protein KatS3mg105_4374 [Gemmatales bacterium]